MTDIEARLTALFQTRKPTIPANWTPGELKYGKTTPNLITIDKADALQGSVTGERVTAGLIEGTSPLGEWRATLLCNGPTMYDYPCPKNDETGKYFLHPDQTRIQSAIRKIVAKLIS
jgi:hypothetical protein